MTQSEFAHAYGIPIDSVQNWEQARRQPDGASLAYLNIIDMEPTYVAQLVAHKRDLNRARIASC